jgi:hypothetical protein
VQLGNTAVINKIRSLEPYTISWSNVPDYMHPADFHRLAQAISAPSDTVHFMHRLVWHLATVAGPGQAAVQCNASPEVLRVTDREQAACCACGLHVPYMRALLCAHAELQAECSVQLWD